MGVDTRCPKCRAINIYASSCITDDREVATGVCIECGHSWRREVIVVPQPVASDRRRRKPAST